MRTAVQDTSRSAYRDAARQSQGATQRQKILDLMVREGGTWAIGEVAVALGIIDGTVSARMNELRQEKVIEWCPTKRRSRVGRHLTVRHMQIVRPGQGELFQCLG